jgi:membrane protease YdiL (CAAX protease family)
MNTFQSLWTVIWKSFAFMLIWGITLAFFIIPFQAKLKQAEQTTPAQARLYFESVSLITMILAAYILVSFVEKRPFYTLGFEKAHILRDISLGTVIGSLWLAASIGILWLGGWISPQKSVPISLPIVMLAGIALFINVITQEIMVRSYIFQTVQTHFGVIAAVIVSSLLFAVFHAGAIKGSWLAALNVFCAGLLFGVAYVVTKNLWLPIAIHFAWNFVVDPVLGLSLGAQNPFRVNWKFLTLNGSSLFTGGAFGLEGSLVVTATTIVAILSLLLLYRQSS